jgi:hypothetical protein
MTGSCLPGRGIARKGGDDLPAVKGEGAGCYRNSALTNLEAKHESRGDKKKYPTEKQQVPEKRVRAGGNAFLGNRIAGGAGRSSSFPDCVDDSRLSPPANPAGVLASAGLGDCSYGAR